GSPDWGWWRSSMSVPRSRSGWPWCGRSAWTPCAPASGRRGGGAPGPGATGILNERAAVEKRLAVVWQDRLDTLSTRLRQALEASTVTRTEEGLRVVAPSGPALTGAGFSLIRALP